MDIVVAARSQLVMTGLLGILQRRLDSVGVYGVTHTAQLLDVVRTGQPDVVVADEDLIRTHERRVCQTVAARGGGTVVLTRSTSSCHELLAAGAQGFIRYEDGADALVSAVRTVGDGNAYIPPELLGGVLRSLIVERRTARLPTSVGLGPTPGIDRLSPREREVLALLGSGADHREIARSLTIAPSTAKTHIYRLLNKLDVRSRTEAAAIAVSNGITCVPNGEYR